jgi:hypothetical protein
MNKRIYVIGDNWNLPVAKAKEFYADDRWAKKKFSTDPNALYNTWVDEIANKIDGYVYYVVDHDFSVGGTIDAAIETINNYKDVDDEDQINYFIINLPTSKGKIDLLSYNPQEQHELEKHLNNVYKGHASKIKSSLDKLNFSKSNDNANAVAKIKKFSEFVEETADYNNRFVIMSVEVERLKSAVLGERVIVGIADPEDDWVSYPLTNIMFANLKDNDAVAVIDYALTRTQTINSQRTNEKNYVTPVFKENASAGKLKVNQFDKHQHRNFGQKILLYLTDTTKLFTI